MIVIELGEKIRKVDEIKSRNQDGDKERMENRRKGEEGRVSRVIKRR